MTREEILALNLQKGERILVEMEVDKVGTSIVDRKTLCFKGEYWIENDKIHSIRRVEPKTEIGCEQLKQQSKLCYVSQEDFRNQKAYERKIYAFNVAREFAIRGEEMPEDLRNEIASYISKSPEIEGVDYVLDIDGNQMRVRDKCERVEYPHSELKGVLTINEIISSMNMKICGSDTLWIPSYFRKVN